MVLRATLARLAAGAEVPVFVARGAGAGDAEDALRRSSRLRVVDTPRQASVLVVVGRVPEAHREALDRIHDQLAHPRATVWWTGGSGDDVRAAWPEATIVGSAAEAVEAVLAAHVGLLRGTRSTEPARLPDVEAAEWRGVGPYGQGGSAMTGGVPYGRPMARRGDDRDGLSLDVVPVTVGPFLPVLPAGLTLKVTFAGDVVHLVEVASWRVPDGGIGAPLDGATPHDAGSRLSLADVELGRARHHLRWLARLLRLYGLDALSSRVLALAERAGPDVAGEVASLRKRLDRSWVLGSVTAGVGALVGDAATAWGGSVARAAGIVVDARLHSSTYLDLGFAPVTFSAGDVRDRWRQRLAEAAQSLDLAARAADRDVEDILEDGVERSAIAPGDGLSADLGALLTGMEWSDAAATIVSLDLALDAPVAVRASA